MITLFLSVCALAQGGLDAHGLHLWDASARPDTPLSSPTALPQIKGSGWLGAAMEYADRPWVVRGAAGGQTERMSEIVALDVAAGFAPVERLQFRVLGPVYLTSTDGTGEAQPTALGDIRLSGHAVVFGDDSISAGLVAALDLPTGREALLLGQPGVAGEFLATGSMGMKQIRAGLGAGAAVRPAIELDGAGGAHALLATASGAVGLTTTLWLGVEGRLERAFNRDIRADTGTPVEIAATVRNRFSTGAHVFGALSTSPSMGAGAPPLRILFGGGFGRAPAPEPPVIPPLIVVEDFESTEPAGPLLVSPPDALVWIPHPVCQWIPMDQAQELLATLPADTRIQLSAPGYLPASAGLDDGSIRLEPAPAQGGLVVLAGPGDEVRVDGVLVEGADDDVFLVNVPEGSHTVRVEGGGRLLEDEAATSTGFAVWLRAPRQPQVNLLFGAGSSALSPAAIALLAPYGAHPGTTAYELVGSHSPEGNSDANRALAQDRADQVKRELIRLGVPAERIAIGQPEPPAEGLKPEEQRSVQVRIRGAR